MNARDLLTALNDIDPKLLEDTLPWGAPVQKSRRPVWAVAAAIVLCVGLVGGVVLSQNYVPQLANDATGLTQGLTELQYAQGNTEKLDQANLRTDLTGLPTYTMTPEELSSLWADGYLAGADQFASIVGTVTTNEDGSLNRVEVRGYLSEAETFVITLAPGEIPPGEESYRLSFLEEPNNTVDGVGIYAAWYDEFRGLGGTQVDSTIYDVGFLLEGDQPVGVTLQMYVDSFGFASEEQAQEFAAGFVSQCLFGGVNLEGLDASSLESQGISLKFDADMDSLTEDLSVLLAEYASQHINNQTDTETVDITPEQLASIWGTPLPWEAYGEVQVESYSILSQEGEPLFAEATGRLATGEQESVYLFDIQLFPQQPSQEWDALAAAYAQQANNHVNGLDVIAGSFTSTEYNAPQTGPAITYYQAMFCTQGDSPMAANLTVFVHPSSSGESPISGKQAQQLVESLMKPAWDGKLDTSVLGGQAISQEPAGHPEVDLAFTIRASSDKTFSNVWNTFTTLYLEPQNLEAHGVEPDYTLTEEELASLWEDAPPWESFLTENDTVEAYGYFSDEGELIKVFVGGYRDNPETTTQEKCQLFSVALYNKDFTGEWGQDVEAALALADTTVNGVAIATEQTDSTVNYQDGASMDSTDFGALFQPASGPTLVTVDGFANPLGFTEEEAQDFVSKTVGGTLYSGVSLDGVNR